MRNFIFMIISCLASIQSLAKQSTEISAYCDDRKLYWVSADTTLRQLRDIEKVQRLLINQYVQSGDCSYAEMLLNYQLARTDGNFVIGAEQKFYWVSPKNTVNDIVTGKVLLLNPIYMYSADDSVKVPTTINISGFAFTAHQGLVAQDLGEYDKKHKQKQLERHFHNAPKP